MSEFFPVAYMNNFFSERSAAVEQPPPPEGGIDKLKKAVLKIPIIRGLALRIWKLVRKRDAI